MSDISQFVRATLRAGARKVLHRRGFRQPGGGWGLYRQHGLVQQAIDIQFSSSGDTGRLSFPSRQTLRFVSLWAWDRPPEFYLDVRHGDPRDLAVEVGHWFGHELLPALEPPLDPLAIARELERREPVTAESLRRAHRLFSVLEFPADAERLRQRLELAFPAHAHRPS